jgi:NAD(P)H-hydrate epimerase
MTLALPKQGLRSAELRKLIGELYLADISVPPALYSSPQIGLSVEPIFASDDIIRLW